MRTLRLLKRCAMFLALVAVRSIHGSPLPAQVANVPKETVTKAQVTCILGSRPASILSMVPTILTAASANSISTCCPIAMLNESFFEYLQSQVISLLTISKRCSKVRVYRGSIAVDSFEPPTGLIGMNHVPIINLQLQNGYQAFGLVG